MVIFIILVAITGVFTYASFFNLGNLDKDVSKEFSLILIPITAGGIVTKFTTDSWQITKEKLGIKRDILSDYENSYKLIGILSDNFLYRVVESYIIYKSKPNSIPFKDYTRPEIEAFLVFPEEDHQPIKQFQIDYNEFRKKLEDAAITQNKLLSSTRLYFGNEELEKLIIQLGDELNNKLDVLRRLMFSDNPTELEKYYKLFTEKTKEVKNKVKEVEEKMIKLKFREINL